MFSSNVKSLPEIDEWNWFFFLPKTNHSNFATDHQFALLVTCILKKIACSKRSDSGERCRVKKVMKSRGGLGREVRERSWYTLWLVDFDNSEKCDMVVMTDSTCRHAEFKLATNTALSDFPNVEAKSEEQRNCLKHVVGRIDVLAISHRLALEKFLFSSFFLE